ncbi:MAG: ATP-binding cassette domain-containing protein [Gemmatimonadaceae bacterium]|nr:ATP-binding cassette domain-containing protein [Gemmatimonadaceae bacterium]
MTTNGTGMLHAERSTFTAAPARGSGGLAAEQVSAWHGTRRVLHDVTLPFPHGEITALVGPSGCGKSTLLRCLNRLHELAPGAAVAGQVRLDGAPVYDASHDVEALRRQVAMVFQRPTPFPAWSIGDNVLAGLPSRGRTLAPAERRARAQLALERAGLWEEVHDRLGASPLSLSGGQQQRLCLARALVTAPRALLLDEPTSALDLANALRLERTFDALRNSMAIVLVTHDLTQARRLADRIAVMWDGALLVHDTPVAVLEEHDDPRVRALVEA